MTVQTEYQQAYNKRLAAIEADPRLTVLSSMNQPQDAAQKKVSQYIVFTDFKFDEQKQKKIQFTFIRLLKMLINMAIPKRIISHNFCLKPIVGITACTSLSWRPLGRRAGSLSTILKIWAWPSLL
ncbi:hypothetical protein CDA65_02188 [Lacticaseibacillus paracasei]|nr:hypothetical protein CDA65_02188 [Lacticaseibacillus paracasei]